jgi:hypothetical protein
MVGSGYVAGQIPATLVQPTASGAVAAWRRIRRRERCHREIGRVEGPRGRRFGGDDYRRDRRRRRGCWAWTWATPRTARSVPRWWWPARSRCGSREGC